MNFVLAAVAAIAKSKASAKPSWNATIRDRIIQDVSCAMGSSGVRPADVYGTGIQTRPTTFGKSLTTQSKDCSVQCSFNEHQVHSGPLHGRRVMLARQVAKNDVVRALYTYMARSNVGRYVKKEGVF